MCLVKLERRLTGSKLNKAYKPFIIFSRSLIISGFFIAKKGKNKMIFRAEKTNNYTVMSNVHLHDKRLTLKAKGLLSMCLSFNDTWDFSMKGLISLSKENRTAVMSALNELKEYGYLTITEGRDKSGKFDYVYTFYENPQGVDLPCVEKPYTENLYTDKPITEKPYTEKPITENVPVLNTNITNTKEINTKELNTKDKYESLDAIVDDRYKDTLKAFIKMRKSIKKPITDYGLKLIINKLDKMTTDNDEKIAILEQSIMNSWQGVFPLKNQVKNVDDRYKGIMEWGND